MTEGTHRDPTTLLVADDFPLYVEGLRHRLEGDPRFRLVGVAGDADTAVRLSVETRPAVSLVGYFLDGPRAPVLFQRLRTASPDTHVVVLAGVVDTSVVHEAVALGARGFLVKQEPGPFVLDALHRVGRGLTAFSPTAELELVAAVRARAEEGDAVPSPRESEILGLLVDGATSREVARRLYVSEATVKTHLGRLYRKLGVNDRSAAVAEAMRRSWVA